MREIKFRAWEDRVMLSPAFTETTMALRGWKQDENYILMQYTGLKDKNGEKIYEGDIVLIEDTYKDRILDDGSGPIEPFNHLAPVVFEHTEFGVEIKDGADIFCSGFWSFARIEMETGQDKFDVIGNLYENPELLGEVKEVK